MMGTGGFTELRLVSPAAWLARDLSNQDVIPVAGDIGLWAPKQWRHLAWWMPGSHAARLAASGVHPRLQTPGWAALSMFDTSVLGRQVSAVQLQHLEEFGGEHFIKPADVKVEALLASVTTPDGFVTAARAAGMASALPVLVSDPVNFTHEYRCFIASGQVLAASAYLIEGSTWGAWHPADLPPTEDAVAFATDAAAQLKMPHLPGGWVLDVGLIDARQWAVVETNPAWCSNPYWSTEGDATGVVRAILAAQGDAPAPALQWQGPQRHAPAGPLPRR